MKIVVNQSSCTGCLLCEVACSFKKQGVFRPAISRISVEKNEEEGKDNPVLCVQCESLLCVNTCSPGAVRKSDGRVLVDEIVCRDCSDCTISCPIGAITMHPDKGIPLICDLCDMDPECVKVCPTDALTISEVRKPVL